MKPKSTLRSFLALTGSSLLAISYSHGQTILADSYLASLSVGSPTTLNASLNFPSYLEGPLTGSSTLTLTGYFGSLLYLTNNGASNAFSGNITVDSGTLRIAGSPFGTTTGGFTAPGMTSSNTITINRAGTLLIDDNSPALATAYTADRFGTGASTNRPAVNLAGGTISLNGNSLTSSVQTLGALTLSSGASTINVTRNFGTATLTFASLTKSSGAYVNFTGTTLGSGTNDGRILFTSAPSLIGGAGIAGTKTMSILAGARSGNDLVWYDSTNGIRALVAAEYNDFAANDIALAGTTENVRITGATPTTVVALGGDKTINSLIMTGTGNLTWAMANKLTLTSGQFMSTANNSRNITSGVITAGSGSAIDLNMTILSNTTTVGTSANINDNGSGVVTLVKAGAGTLALANNTTNNGYSGGTYVLEGTLTTGATASRAYLGSGKVTVNNAILTLGAIGATSNASGDDYTAINGAAINIASGTTGAYTSADTFNIAANSIIAGGSASGQGLASLTRGTNITLASGAIIGQAALTAALNTGSGTIQSLGTSADLYYGLNATQNSVSGSINIGSGTAFRGISTVRAAGAWQQGTINIASGTTGVDFQGLAVPGVAPVVLTLGNGATAGAPVINFAGSGTVDIRALGALTVNDGTATYGNTGASQNVRFVSTAGSTLTVTTATGMGSGSGIASALVQNGGILAIGAADALNGAVTVQSGGKFNANLTAGLTGTGALTFNAGSIIDITSVTGFSGAQASGASIAAGTIVRLNANSFGAASATLDSVLGSGSNAPIFIIYGNNRAAAEPTAPNTSILTLNKDINGVGGILTNFESSNRGLSATTNGVVTLGARGGTIASTTGNSMEVAEDITGSGSLTIGTTDIIDGLPKLGAVKLSNASNNFTGGIVLNAGRLNFTLDAHLGDAANSITFNGGELGLTSGSTMSTAHQLILNPVAGNLFFMQGGTTWSTSAAVTGAGGITFKGNPSNAVTVNLNNANNTFTGTLGIESGGVTVTVALNSMLDSGSVGAGNVVFGASTNAQTFNWNSGNALSLSNRQFEFGGTGTAVGTIQNSSTTGALTINTNLVSGSGAKTLTLNAVVDGPRNAFNGNIADGTGAVTLIKTGVGDWVLGGTNSYTGGTTIGASAGGLTFLNTGAKSSSGTHAFGALSMLGLGVSGASGFTATDIVNAFAGTMTGNLSGITVASNTNVGVDTTNGDFTLSSGIATTAKQLHKLGDNTLKLTGTNLNTGVVIAKQGTLQFGTTASMANAVTTNWTAARFAARSGATLAFNVGGPSGEFTTGNVTTLLTNLAASTSTTNGMNAGSNLGFDTTNASGTFTITTVIADTTGTSGGARGFTKLGTGTLELTETNTYTGATLVSAGTLLINGDNSAATGAVTVASGATLGGTGQVGGNTTILTGGYHAPGVAQDNQDFLGNLTYSSGSIFSWDIDTASTNTDSVTGTASGALTGSGAVFNITSSTVYTDPFWSTTQSWNDIFSGFGTSGDWNNIFTSISGGGLTWNGSKAVASTGGYFTLSTTSLNWTAVPEPTSALAGLLLGAGLLRRRK